MVAQIRSAKAQADSGNPAMVTVRRTLCTKVMATADPWFLRLPGAAGGEQVGRIDAHQTAQRDVVGPTARLVEAGRIDEAALHGLAVVPFHAPGAQCDAVRGAPSLRDVLPRELPGAVDMPTLARAEFGPRRHQIGALPTR